MSPAAAHCNADAEKRLRGLHVELSEVVWVDIDSVLYLDRNLQPMTAWLRGTLVAVEPRFCAERGVPFGIAAPAPGGVQVESD